MFEYLKKKQTLSAWQAATWRAEDEAARLRRELETALRENAALRAEPWGDPGTCSVCAERNAARSALGKNTKTVSPRSHVVVPDRDLKASITALLDSDCDATRVRLYNPVTTLVALRALLEGRSSPQG